MKATYLKYALVFTATAVGAVFLLFVGCAKNDGGGGGGGGGGTSATKCPNGQGYSTQYAQCLQQSGTGCPTGTGLYRSSCVPVSQCASPGLVYTQAGCLPQGQCRSGFGDTGTQCLESLEGNYYDAGYDQSYNSYNSGYSNTNYGRPVYPYQPYSTYPQQPYYGVGAGFYIGF